MNSVPAVSEVEPARIPYAHVVVNLRNSLLLRSISTSNLKEGTTPELRPKLIRGSIMINAHGTFPSASALGQANFNVQGIYQRFYISLDFPFRQARAQSLLLCLQHVFILQGSPCLYFEQQAYQGIAVV